MIEHSGPPVSGRFMLCVYDSGRLVHSLDEPNLIVASSKQILSRLLGGDPLAWAVTQIGFGVNGSKPALGNTGLQNGFVRALGTTTYPNGKTISFNYALDADEAVGKPISEFGLLSGNNILFARKVTAKPIVKTNTLSFSGRWDIIF